MGPIYQLVQTVSQVQSSSIAGEPPDLISPISQRISKFDLRGAQAASRSADQFYRRIIVLDITVIETKVPTTVA